MSRRLRRTHTPAFKAKVALAAINGEQTLGSWSSSLTICPIERRVVPSILQTRSARASVIAKI